MPNAQSLTIVKVGGSLYDLPDLGPRLSAWLATITGDVILVPGGGPMVETIRQLDGIHHLGEETCHWLALRTLTLNAHFLARLLPLASIIDDPLRRTGPVCILDAHPFALADEARPGRLPHSWAVTSDSLALRTAIVAEAGLVLLKSIEAPATECGISSDLVDRHFAELLRQAQAGLVVEIVNLRAWARHSG